MKGSKAAAGRVIAGQYGPMESRLVIDRIRPTTLAGDGPGKAAIGERVTVSAWIYRDGHDPLGAVVRWRPSQSESSHEDTWSSAPLEHHGNDEWSGHFVPERVGMHEFVVEAWAEHDGQPSQYDRSTSEPMPLWVDRPKARFSAWYELFPRSEGGFAGAAKRLDAVADMGFDVVYLPPVHPIGITARKGPGNTLVAGPGDPGSPWGIGSAAGGHEALNPELGTLDDFSGFVARARDLGMEVALDYALQCSPDHPWVHQHPEWFHRRPDGTIRCAENPPKVYEDIFPINFWPVDDAGAPDDEARAALWQACRDLFEIWISRGIEIFRVDNPHTKPIAFWAWVIPDVQAAHPDVLFLAEAFTRPKPMAKLAEIGFSQSYTYFTWRHTRLELTSYLEELAHGPTVDYFRPNFWPNTPDILGGILRHGNAAAFELRATLAATMTPNWGIYSGYELCENQPASDSNEEYLHSEKYQLRDRNWDDPASLAPFIGKLNAIRRAHPAFAELRTIHFHDVDNDQLIVYSKTTVDGADPVLVVVNLDPHHVQAGTLHLDLGTLGFSEDTALLAYDELSGVEFDWQGSRPWVELDPAKMVAHIISLRQKD